MGIRRRIRDRIEGHRIKRQIRRRLRDIARGKWDPYRAPKRRRRGRR